MDTNALKRDETSGTSLKVIGNRLGRVLLPVFLAISLTACDKYDTQDANADLKQFNSAFREQNIAKMRASADRFATAFDADYLTGPSNPYGCKANSLISLEHDVPKVQKSAIDWIRDSSGPNALNTLAVLEEREAAFSNRTKDCETKELGQLEPLRELIALVRTDIENTHDVSALAEEEKAKKAEIIAERRANCELTEWEQKNIFQQFVRLEDEFGLEKRDMVVGILSDSYRISHDCVHQIAQNATYNHPEWIP
ncbi:MAG: hypothetical protein CME16_02760 [Gemmatimonadetes bacterium]|nr:hypothetical protein [Gemmatimonadota bacterium]|tara:strand:- start:286 stop:1047 length:762 start_codon:yes stop_codon:yes gene_type:complete